MDTIFNKNNIIYFLLIIIVLIFLLTFKNYGIGIEEHFQRKSGFYWLNYLLNFTNFDSLKNLTETKIIEINTFTPNLFPIEEVPYYGVLFDLPLAYIETFFNISDPINYFYLRHVSISAFFLLSGFYFYKIINLRFNNLYLALFGFLIFVFTPRIYGNAFFDNKDILFLSMFTINMYFYLKFNKTNRIKDLIIFALLCAFSTSTRIIGILIPFSFYILLLFKSISEKRIKDNIKIFFIFTLSFLIFLFIHWPYLWTLNISQWLNFFSPFFQAMNPTVFFNGEFYQSKFLPMHYLPLWIILTTPAYLILIFLLGFVYQTRRFFLRFILIEESKLLYKDDLWRSNNEKYDLYIFLNFLSVIILYFSTKLALLSGWRHFYFLNFFIIYYSCFFIFILMNLLRNKDNLKKTFIYSLIFFIILHFSDLYKYHPFQSVYFNNLISDNYKKKFEVDTQSISRVHAIKEILKDNKNTILISTASWTPLENARSLIERKYWDKLVFLGTNNKEKADYIYSNHYYEVNTNFNKKYEIPENFSLYKTLKIDGTRIYSIYKKN
tara:strand:+ start:1891 stop:3543 length:1653 start_codon:yes stop_codon:yes gene_type:complete